ncbi:MAG: tetratricopeptide repeat protein, partial [Chloroflexi bacterium]|nr:tetratricopeptide repeat protein [Chloroflexota bacterium]
HLILASRRLPTLPDLPILVARQQVGGFDLNELAFRPAEIRLLFEQGYGVTLADTDVEELARRTEGWVTGLHLAQLGSSHGLPDLTHAARVVGVDLSGYFDQQVLGQQTPEVRSFLLQTALLEDFDAALCDSVLGVGNWRAVMDTVRRNNLFVLSIGLHGEWMRYHSLFKDFLQERIRQENPETVQAILLRLAEVSEERGDLEKAHHALAQVGDRNTLAGLVERAGSSLIDNGRILTLSVWLEELPMSQAQENPNLLLLAGIVSLFKGQVQYGLDLIDRGCTTFRAAGDKVNAAAALVERSWAVRLLGEYQEALQAADEAIGLVTGNPEGEYLVADASRMKGLALYRLGRVNESEQYLKNAMEIFVRLRREKSLPHIQLELGMIRRALGDPVSAQAYYEKALNTWQEQGNLTSQATLLNNLGVLHHARGEYEKAVQTFEKGLDCARRSGYLRSQALILASLGDVYTDIFDLEAAGLLYQQVYDIAVKTTDHFLVNYAQVCLAGIARLSGDHRRARLLLDNAGMSLQKTGSHYEIGLHALESGRLSLDTERPKGAILDLNTALENFEQGGLQAEAAWARLWLATVQGMMGESESASAGLEAVLHPLEGGELPPSFLPNGLQVRNWLAALVEENGKGQRIRIFLEKVDSFQRQLPSLRRRLRRLTSVVSAAVPELVIRGFGKPHVKAKGRTVNNAQWHSRAVREMFFLFVHSQKPLTKEQIGEILWPESAPEDLKLRFKNELYRLRRAVGKDVILFDGNTYSFNRDLDFDYDVDTFKDNLRRARSSKNAEEKLRAFQEAVAVMRGPYLEGIDSTWVLTDREQLQQEYLDALLTLAGLLLDRKDTSEALKICRYALVADKTLEEAYRLLMRIYAARGDRMGVTHQYQACREALEDELGVPISMETEALYRQLTS